MQTVLDLLKSTYPPLRDYTPLAIGIVKQLLASHPDISDRQMRIVMASHCRGDNYLVRHVEGAQRVNLDRSAPGVITAKQAAYAQRLRKARGAAENPSTTKVQPKPIEPTAPPGALSGRPILTLKRAGA